MTLKTKIIIIILCGFWITMQANPRIIEIDNATDFHMSIRASKNTQDCKVIESLKTDVINALKKLSVGVGSPSNFLNIPLVIKPHTTTTCDIKIPTAKKKISAKGLKVSASRKQRSCKYPFLRFHTDGTHIHITNHDGQAVRSIGSMRLGAFDDERPYKLTIKQADTGFLHQFIMRGIQMNLIRHRYYVTTASHPLKPNCSFVILLETLDARERKHVHA
jgi:hypothetical protein